MCNLKPTSRGTIHIASPDATVAPAIRPNYLSTDVDRQVAVESLKLTRRIVAQPALARFKPVEYKPGPEFQTDEELMRMAGGHRHDDLPPGRHLQDGPQGRPGAQSSTHGCGAAA